MVDTLYDSAIEEDLEQVSTLKNSNSSFGPIDPSILDITSFNFSPSFDESLIEFDEVKDWIEVIPNLDSLLLNTDDFLGIGEFLDMVEDDSCVQASAQDPIANESASAANGSSNVVKVEGEECTTMEKLSSPVKEELKDLFPSHVDQLVTVLGGSSSNGVISIDSGLTPVIDESMSCKIEKEIGNISLNVKEESKSSSSEETESSSSEESESSSSEEDSDSDNEVEKMANGSKLKVEAKMEDVGQIEEGEIKEDESDEDDYVEGSKSGPIKSKNEVSKLHPVLPVEVTLQPHHQTLPVGAISSIFGSQVIVEGAQHEPLDEDSILWITESRVPLGRIDEIFGPVKAPYYVVRYNSENEIPTEAVIGTLISYVPEFASHVLKNKYVYQKGYDASGKYDEEDLDEIEFSDDEKEAEYRRSLKTARGKNVQKSGNNKKGKDANLKIDKKSDVQPKSGSGQEKIWSNGVSPGAPYTDQSAVPQPVQPQHNVMWTQQNMVWPQQNMVWPQQNQMFDFNQRMLMNSQPGSFMGQGPWQQGYIGQNFFNPTPFGVGMPGQRPYPSPYGGHFQNVGAGGQSVHFQNVAGGQGVPFQNPAGGQGTGGQGAQFHNQYNGVQRSPTQNTGVQGSNDHDEPPGFSSNVGKSADSNLGRGGGSHGGGRKPYRRGGGRFSRGRGGNNN